MKTKASPTSGSGRAPRLGCDEAADIVEFPLLLPKSEADALLKLSKARQQSIAQILRNWIHDGLELERLDSQSTPNRSESESVTPIEITIVTERPRRRTKS